jgi:CBS domain containing-hemolysin-like protein
VGDDVVWDGLRFDVLEVEGNRIEKIAVEFSERPPPRRADDDLLRGAPEDDLE